MTGSKLVERVVGVAAASVFAWTVTPSPLASADSGQSVRTQSGKVRCYVFVDDTGHGGGPSVACQRTEGGSFAQAPMMVYGSPANIARTGSDGRLGWLDGNIAGWPSAIAQDVVMGYGQTYRVNGWTIPAAFDGTRFTNDATGHGMFVSIDNVYGF